MGALQNVARIPAHPKIYHITHMRNLSQIVEAGVLWSDAKRIELGLDCDVVGMPKIKERRLNEIKVACQAGTLVGDYVPFYFSPRSIMLFILHKRNHPDLNYTEGQQPIVHLQADLHAVVRWAEAHHRRWAFSDRNAGTYYCKFYADIAQLDEVNWDAVAATDFRDSTVKEGKQAEFLVYESFPCELIERMGVLDRSAARQATEVISAAGLDFTVDVKKSWYY